MVIDIYTMNPPPSETRQRILTEMATIEQMEYGQLDTFFQPSAQAPGQRRGPYHKRQVWQDGRNHTEYVPAAQVAAITAAIAGRERFERLAGDFVAATVQATRGTQPASKKTGRNRRPTASRRPRPS
jgi:hypothetical protein